MPGVAHTFGSEIYKEIHFSLDHIQNSASRAKDEIMGVLTHEVVHCFQHTGKDKPFPGGLGEGIADWVRLRAGLAPPHWKEGRGGTWDAGYEATGYFLDWLEERYGYGIVQELNGFMKDRPWEEGIFKELTGRKIGKLWELYKEHLGEKNP
ncbi:hypothetical protein PHLCEN_2v2791 [Hermanssonia centrifuga]|uniref:Plant basic secretory protein n=1 Tax=Hermanssonia centrifuga TaxID=98765 RepID=A0A2R6RI02_9APHY|nr:hypothetical protein PHLCEN_2v2791 [Hermanssonia centrifuga]